MDFDWPFPVAGMEWGIQKAGVQFTGPYNGTRQAIEFAAERWMASVTLTPRTTADSGAVEAFFERLAGGVNRVRLWHLARPYPLGSLRGTPTVATAAVRGNMTLALQTGDISYDAPIGYAQTGAPYGVGGELKAGDMISAGGQLFKCAEDCHPNSTGVLTVPTTTRVRGPIAAGALVTWAKPTALFCVPSSSMRFAHMPAILNSLAVDLEEVW